MSEVPLCQHSLASCMHSSQGEKSAYLECGDITFVPVLLVTVADIRLVSSLYQGFLLARPNSHQGSHTRLQKMLKGHLPRGIYH